MVISCPNCATRFKVADHLVADRPVKLKCSKCRHVFTYTRRKEEPRPEAPSHPRMPVVRPPGAVIGAPPAGGPAEEKPAEEKPAPAMAGEPVRPGPGTVIGETKLDDEFESFEPEPEPAGSEALEPPEPETARPPAAEPDDAMPVPGSHVVSGDAPVDEDDPTAAFEVALDRQAGEPARAAAAPVVRQQEAAPEPRSSLSAPITLEDVFPSAEPPSRTGRAAGILSAAVLLMLLAFVVFVAGRNGWDLSGCASDPLGAIRVALGLAPRVYVAKEARGIEAAVVESYKAQTVDGREILVVDGEVLNTSGFPKQGVMVEVGIVNSQGVGVFEQEAIAGITLMSREAMAGRSFLEILEQVEEDRKRAASRVIRSNLKANFQVFFTTFPPGVEDSTLYNVQVLVKDARNAPSQ